MQSKLEVLNNDWVESDIVFDGPSLPILEVGLKYGGRSAFVLLNKSQAEQLVQILQRQLTEM